MLSMRIINVLGCEISLGTGFPGSSSYPIRPVPRRVAARRIRALDEVTGADNADTDARRTDAGRSHRTPDGRTPDGWTPDAYRTPDTGRADAGHADADAGRGQGDQGTVGIRTSWHHGAAGTANRVAVGGSARGVRQP